MLVERGAGEEAQLLDGAYEQAGATLVDKATIWSQSNVILKVRSPQEDGPINEIAALQQGSTVISFLYPAQNKPLVEKLASRGVTTFAMDMIPRISRAQTFDALRYVYYHVLMALSNNNDCIQFHGQYCRVQSCPRGIQSFWSLSDGSSDSCWVSEETVRD